MFSNKSDLIWNKWPNKWTRGNGFSLIEMDLEWIDGVLRREFICFGMKSEKILRVQILRKTKCMKILVQPVNFFSFFRLPKSLLDFLLDLQFKACQTPITSIIDTVPYNPPQSLKLKISQKKNLFWSQITFKFKPSASHSQFIRRITVTSRQKKNHI